MTKPYRTVIEVRSTTQDLTTLESVKTDLGLDPLDTTKDDFIAAQIKQVSSLIATQCNRVFGEETLSNYFNVGWCYNGALELSRVPVTEILEVNQSSGQLGDYELDEESGLLWPIGAGEFWQSNWIGGQIHVQFKAGYQLLATLPYDLERAANLMIKGNYYAQARDPLIRSESIPGVMSFDYGSSATVRLDSGSSEVGRLLAPYKLPSYG